MQYPLSHIPDTIRDSISVKCIRISTLSECVYEFCYWVFNLFILEPCIDNYTENIVCLCTAWNVISNCPIRKGPVSGYLDKWIEILMLFYLDKLYLIFFLFIQSHSLASPSKGIVLFYLDMLFYMADSQCMIWYCWYVAWLGESVGHFLFVLCFRPSSFFVLWF